MDGPSASVRREVGFTEIEVVEPDEPRREMWSAWGNSEVSTRQKLLKSFCRQTLPPGMNFGERWLGVVGRKHL